ncbi:ethanolamine ammonia-lyase subunit EutB, partial [Bacillus sp. SIMBA_074]
MKLSAQYFGEIHQFKSLKEVLAKANEEKSGDRLAGIAADSVQERIAAKAVLSELTLADIRNYPLLSPEEDEVSRIIDGLINGT